MMNKIPAITGDIIGLPEWAKRKLYTKNWEPLILHVQDNERGISFFIDAFLWDYFCYSLKEDAPHRLHDTSHVPLTREAITPYLQSFSAGFSAGYFNFEVTDELSNKDAEIRRIFQIASWQDKGIATLEDERGFEYITKESCYESGISAGRWYHALYLMVNNYELFGKYFDELNDPARQFRATLFELALFFHYSKKVITRKNQAQKAKEAGYKGKASKLYPHYCHVSRLQNRISNKGTVRKNEFHMKHLCKVISMLETNTPAYNQAISDRFAFSKQSKTDIPENK